jgi:hypothetical protein
MLKTIALKLGCNARRRLRNVAPGNRRELVSERVGIGLFCTPSANECAKVAKALFQLSFDIHHVLCLSLRCAFDDLARYRKLSPLNFSPRDATQKRNGRQAQKIVEK